MKHLYFILLGFVFALFYGQGSAFANDIRLAWPVACSVSQDCWIVNHVDAEPLTGRAKDFACGDMTYDAHKGTDIAILDRATMDEGIAVLAPLDGTVLRIRNNKADHRASDIDPAMIKASGEECGNGLMIDHGYGWQTQ